MLDGPAATREVKGIVQQLRDWAGPSWGMHVEVAVHGSSGAVPPTGCLPAPSLSDTTVLILQTGQLPCKQRRQPVLTDRNNSLTVTGGTWTCCQGWHDAVGCSSYRVEHEPVRRRRLAFGDYTTQGYWQVEGEKLILPHV